MRHRFFLALAAVAAAVSLPALANDDEAGSRAVVLKANQVGQIFCLSRTGNDDAVISGILTEDLGNALKTAEDKNAEWARKFPGEKPPLGDGIPWQSTADHADSCEIGLVTLSRTDARVEIKYGYKAAPQAGYVDTLILKKIPAPGLEFGRWRIDDVLYPDGSNMKAALVSAFASGDSASTAKK